MTSSLPTLSVARDWEELLRPAGQAALELILPGYIQGRRWFGGKARSVASAQITETIAIGYRSGSAHIIMIQVVYAEGQPEVYMLPLAFASGPRAEQLANELPHAALARLRFAGGQAGLLYDPLVDRDFCAALLAIIADQRRLPGRRGQLRASTTSAFERLRGPAGASLDPKVGTAEQSNTSIIYGNRLIMKLFRRLEPGLNPDLELGRFLTERGFHHSPPAAGAIEYQAADGGLTGLAFLQGFVPNQGDAWHYTLTMLAHAFAEVWANTGGQVPQSAAAPAARQLDLVGHAPPVDVQAFIQNYVDSARLLGRRTAELHLALASDTADPDFAPEPFTIADQRAIYASMRERALLSLRALERTLAAGSLPEPVRAGAEQVLGLEPQILDRYRSLLDQEFTAMRTRLHGDYHLGQVLYTGSDFLIIDFEGEPARPLSERRRKGSPIQDIAGMLRSFHYAPYAVLFGQAPGFVFGAEQIAALEPWASLWQRWISVAFVETYLATAGQAPFLPRSPAQLATLLDAFLLDKAVYELNYELNNRPAWVQIPVEGVLQLLGSSQ